MSGPRLTVRHQRVIARALDGDEEAREELAEWCQKNPTTNNPNRTKKRQPAAKRRKPKPPELLAAERVVRERSGGMCEARTIACEGRATQAHHMAGRSDHRPEVLLGVCGQGNYSGCHGYIHQHPAESYANGWMVKRNGVRS